MCKYCDASDQRWGDITERFEFENETLEYYDGPISGWLRCRGCADRFAFYCEGIVSDLLWHWNLLPVATEQSFKEAFYATRQETEVKCFSIVEDRRLDGKSSCTGVWIRGKFRFPMELFGASGF